MNFLIAELALFENLSAPDLSLACHPQRFPFTILPDVFLPPPVRSRSDQPLTSVIIAQRNKLMNGTRTRPPESWHRLLQRHGLEIHFFGPYHSNTWMKKK